MACLFTKAFILSAVRSLLSEPVPLIFSDDAINNWIEEAAVDLSAKSLCYEVEDDITTAENTMEYSEPTDCLKVHACYKGGTPTGWTAHFDDDDWWNPDENLNITWQTDRWKILNWAGDTDGTLQTKPGSTWAVAYRPTKIRVTLDVTSISYVGGKAIRLDKTGPVEVFSQATYTSLEEISFTLDADIRNLFFQEAPSARDVYITNIEFYGALDADYDYKSLIQIHPRLVNHLPHDSPGEPICYYHHHNKIGFWPIPDDVYNIRVVYSKRTDDITNIPCHMRHFAVLDCLAKARLSEGWKDDYAMLNGLYLNNLMFHRNDIWQPGYEVDSMVMLQIPDVGEK